MSFLMQSFQIPTTLPLHRTFNNQAISRLFTSLGPATWLHRLVHLAWRGCKTSERKLLAWESSNSQQWLGQKMKTNAWYIYICTYTVFIRYTLVYIHRKASSNIQIHTPKSLSEILLRTWHWWPLQPKWLVIANHPLRPGRKNCEDLKFQPPSDRVFYGAWKVSSSWPNVTS